MSRIKGATARKQQATGRLEDSSRANKKEKTKKTQARPDFEERKHCCFGAHTAVTGATKARNIASPFPQSFPSKSAAKSRFRTRKIVGARHMMPEILALREIVESVFSFSRRKRDKAFQASLPGEGLLEDVNLRVRAPVANRLADVVGETASAADTDGHGADLPLLLLLDQSTNVGLTREHLHAGTGRVDLLGAARAGDKEQDAEDIATLLHAEDLCHPRADPFKVLGRLDDPDKSDLASGVRAVGVSGNEIADVRNLVSDTNTGGEKHDGAVRSKALFAVGTLDEGPGSEFATRRHLGLLEQGVGETSAATNNERHVGAAGTESVLAGDRESFLSVPLVLLFAPGKGERVAGRSTNGRHVHVDVLTRSELPGLSDAKSDSDGVTRESLDFGVGATVANIAAKEADDTDTTLDDPDDDSGHDEALLTHALAVHPDTDNGGDGEQDVNAKEGLVESVTNDRR